MRFFDKLQAHIGGLVRLNTEIFWYNSNFWDGIEDRICILLEAPAQEGGLDGTTRRQGAYHAITVLLLIDGSSKCVSISEENVEFIQ